MTAGDHLIDIMPTLCELAGANYPGAFGGRKITPAQGISMVPFIMGAAVNVLPYPEKRGNPRRVPWPPRPWPKE